MVRQDCGACHGMRLTGGLGPALTREALADKPIESLVATIVHGRPGHADAAVARDARARRTRDGSPSSWRAAFPSAAGASRQHRDEAAPCSGAARRSGRRAGLAQRLRRPARHATGTGDLGVVVERARGTRGHRQHQQPHAAGRGAGAGRPVARLGGVRARRRQRLRVRPRRRADACQPAAAAHRRARACRPATRSAARSRPTARWWRRRTTRPAASRCSTRARSSWWPTSRRSPRRVSVRASSAWSTCRAGASPTRCSMPTRSASPTCRNRAQPQVTRFDGIGRQPYDALVTPDGRHYIAGLFGEDGLALIDLWDREPRARRILAGYGRGEQPLPVYKMPHLRGWAVAGRHAYLPAVGRHEVLVVDTLSWQEVGRIAVAGQPVFVIARPDGRQVWVNFAVPDYHRVQVIDTLDAARRAHARAGQGRPAHGIHAARRSGVDQRARRQPRGRARHAELRRRWPRCRWTRRAASSSPRARRAWGSEVTMPREPRRSPLLNDWQRGFPLDDGAVRAHCRGAALQRGHRHRAVPGAARRGQPEPHRRRVRRRRRGCRSARRGGGAAGATRHGGRAGVGAAGRQPQLRTRTPLEPVVRA